LFSSLSFAFEQKKALRGLKGVTVVVSYIPPEIERLGLKRNMIQANVETKLKKLGIKVYKKLKSPTTPILLVRINAIYVKSKSIISYHIGVNLVEWVFLKREIGSVGDLMEVQATDWYNGKVGFVGTSSVKIILKNLEELVDKFSYDYLSVNPS
jgi:hypothetical protein